MSPAGLGGTISNGRGPRPWPPRAPPARRPPTTRSSRTVPSRSIRSSWRRSPLERRRGGAGQARRSACFDTSAAAPAAGMALRQAPQGAAGRRRSAPQASGKDGRIATAAWRTRQVCLSGAERRSGAPGRPANRRARSSLRPRRAGSSRRRASQRCPRSRRRARPTPSRWRRVATSSR